MRRRSGVMFSPLTQALTPEHSVIRCVQLAVMRSGVRFLSAPPNPINHLLTASLQTCRGFCHFSSSSSLARLKTALLQMWHEFQQSGERVLYEVCANLAVIETLT